VTPIRRNGSNVGRLDTSDATVTRDERVEKSDLDGDVRLLVMLMVVARTPELRGKAVCDRATNNPQQELSTTFSRNFN